VTVNGICEPPVASPVSVLSISAAHPTIILKAWSSCVSNWKTAVAFCDMVCYECPLCVCVCLQTLNDHYHHHHLSSSLCRSDRMQFGDCLLLCRGDHLFGNLRKPGKVLELKNGQNLLKYTQKFGKVTECLYIFWEKCCV